jgi:feruloyl esterase
MAGGGGFNGSLPNLNQGLTLNFATAGTDSGHAGFPLDASFAYNPPDNSNPNAAQKKEDFSFRSYHETAHLAKKIIKAFYGHHPRYSYWVGCSEGGREALMMAQRFQDLFDGIIAGAPVLYLTKAHMWSIWNPRALLDGPVTADQLPFLADAIYWKCDGIDGLVDGLIDDPRNCAFDPRKDLPICSTASATCFTTAQTEALHKIYDGVRNSAGRLLFPGQPPGAEVFAGGVSGWVPWIIGSPSLQELIGTSSMQYFSLTPPPGPTWKITDYNFDTDPARMLQTSKMVDMINPNLWEFKHRGGKMIHYAGWADTALTPLMTVNYYESVLDFMGKENTKEFYKLYMIPGMAHCGGGVGCFDSRTNGDVIKLLDAVVEWVEHGIEPYTFVGSRVDNNGTVLRTRPLCPYPAVERYLGKGDINDAKSFVCVVPKHGHDHHDRDHEEWDRE